MSWAQWLFVAVFVLVVGGVFVWWLIGAIRFDLEMREQTARAQDRLRASRGRW